MGKHKKLKAKVEELEQRIEAMELEQINTATFSRLVEDEVKKLITVDHTKYHFQVHQHALTYSCSPKEVRKGSVYQKGMEEILSNQA